MIDGGMVNNNWFCQQLANTLQVEVSRPVIIETKAVLGRGPTKKIVHHNYV